MINLDKYLLKSQKSQKNYKIVKINRCKNGEKYGDMYRNEKKSSSKKYNDCFKGGKDRVKLNNSPQLEKRRVVKSKSKSKSQKRTKSNKARQSGSKDKQEKNHIEKAQNSNKTTYFDLRMRKN